MKVRMLTSLAGTDLALSVGEEAELDDGLAAALCADGRAEMLERPAGRKPRGKQSTSTPRGEKR